MDNALLYNKIASLPENMKQRVLDFIEALAMQNNNSQKKTGPQFGSAKGMFIMHPDFEEPLEDFKEYMQ